MGNNKRKWEKLEGCDCLRCREVEVYVDQKHEKYEKKNAYQTVNVNVDCKDCRHEEKNCDCHDKKHKDDCDKCKGPTDKFEFQYDKSFLSDEILDENRIPVLSVKFNKICANDKVWLSGIVGFDNDPDIFDQPATIRLTIVRSTTSGPEREIYRQTFEIDEPGQDDRTQVPFADVQYEANDAYDVTYTVYVVRLEDAFRNVFLFGQNTLTALRIS